MQPIVLRFLDRKSRKKLQPFPLVICYYKCIKKCFNKLALSKLLIEFYGKQLFKTNKKDKIWHDLDSILSSPPLSISYIFPFFVLKKKNKIRKIILLFAILKILLLYLFKKTNKRNNVNFFILISEV